MTTNKDNFIADVYHLVDNWGTVKQTFESGTNLSLEKYPFTILWNKNFVADTNRSFNMYSATIEFKQRFGNGGLELGDMEVVIKAGQAQWHPSDISRTPKEANTTFAVIKTHIGVMSKKEYKYIDTKRFDEYCYYSLTSAVIWRLQLIGYATPRLYDKAFDYSFDDFIYHFLTGEESDFLNLTEEQKKLVDLKVEEAKDFLHALHEAITTPLKLILKD